MMCKKQEKDRTGGVAKEHRYFLIFFTYIYKESGNHGYGNCTSVDVKFPSRNNINEELERDHEITEVAATNIKELSKEDYESWKE